MTRQKPQTLAKRWLTHSRLFHVEEIQLRFGNGAERTYERLNPQGHGAVMVLPLADDEHVYMVREYGGGIDDYYLSFPKGAMHPDESIPEAANRELMEEIGFGAHHLEHLHDLALSPSYMGNRMSLVLAWDLFEKRLEGDEPEELEVVRWPLRDVAGLLSRGDFVEAYAVAAFFMLRERLGIR